jgi:hypothetical protein
VNPRWSQNVTRGVTSVIVCLVLALFRNSAQLHFGSYAQTLHSLYFTGKLLGVVCLCVLVIMIPIALFEIRRDRRRIDAGSEA